MTRKDYELIAETFRDMLAVAVLWDDEAKGIGAIARVLATRLEEDNPRFDRDKFLNACGVADV